MLIGDLMNVSGVGFGTSGARGLATDMTDRVCYAYTVGFLRYLLTTGAATPGCAVALAGDLRPSTGRILNACARAALDLGCRPRYCGRVPSPAVAAYGIAHGIPSLMVTGSHIPDDRNGIKFNLPTGEVLKADEAGIRAQAVAVPDGLFDGTGMLRDAAPPALPPAEPAAYAAYVRRYLDFFPAGCLAGLRVGVYEHSSVARGAYVEVLEGLGARVTRLGWSDRFIPVDTEAIRPEDVALARDWAAGGTLDALVSADGDGDRPLVADETGQWLRGDIAGILCARRLGVRALVTPVSSNTAVERCGAFARVLRTRIGSPYVIEGMQQLRAAGLAPVAGYEANGGFLLETPIEYAGRTLAALPTRDALLVALTILLAAVEQGRPVSALAADLPARFTCSDRIKDFPTELSTARLAALTSGDAARDRAAIAAVFGPAFGPVAGLDTTDGLRITFASGEIAHLRPSGNAPELRAYTEAASPERAAEMNATCMAILAGWRGGPSQVNRKDRRQTTIGDPMKIETQAIHAGFAPDPTTKSVATPIYQTTSYAFDDTQHGADLFDLKVAGNIYTRIMNPTSDVLEQRVAAMEGGVGALALASGMAAVTNAIFTITKAGDNIVAVSTLYGGTYNLFAHTLPRLGIQVRFAAPNDIAGMAAQIDANTRAVFCESIGNPAGNVADITAIADMAHAHGVPVIVDNTVPSPYLCRPFEHGGDIVVHALTKYMGGHGTSIGGILVDSGKFPWAEHADRFPMLNEPDVSYHGVAYTRDVGAAAYIARARVVPLRNMGACISPFNSFLILQGIETLHVRMDRHCENALRVAGYLKDHPKVEWVRYAGLPDSPDYPLVQRYMDGGKASSILSFGIKGGLEAGARFIDALKLAVRLVNIGDAKTLACHPATTTHRQLAPEELARAGVSRDLVRLSIGIEHVDDIVADLDQALAAAA